MCTFHKCLVFCVVFRLFTLFCVLFCFFSTVGVHGGANWSSVDKQRALNMAGRKRSRLSKIKKQKTIKYQPTWNTKWRNVVSW